MIKDNKKGQRMRILTSETLVRKGDLLDVPEGVAEILQRGDAALGKDSPLTNRKHNALCLVQKYSLREALPKSLPIQLTAMTLNVTL